MVTRTLVLYVTRASIANLRYNGFIILSVLYILLLHFPKNNNIDATFIAFSESPEQLIGCYVTIYHDI